MYFSIALVFTGVMGYFISNDVLPIAISSESKSTIFLVSVLFPVLGAIVFAIDAYFKDRKKKEKLRLFLGIH